MHQLLSSSDLYILHCPMEIQCCPKMLVLRMQVISAWLSIAVAFLKALQSCQKKQEQYTARQKLLAFLSERFYQGELRFKVLCLKK